MPLSATAPGPFCGRLLAHLGAGALLAGWCALEVWPKLLTCWAVPPLAFYLLTPLGGALGWWRYLSAYLVAQGCGIREPIALHLGTTYDALWRLRSARRPGERLFQTMHRELYRGLAAFCREVEGGAIGEDTIVTACSYFLTPKQMARYGFHETTAPFLKRLCFVVGYPEVLLQQWIITGRLRLYNPLRIRCYRSTAAEVAARRSYFARLAARNDPPA